MPRKPSSPKLPSYKLPTTSGTTSTVKNVSNTGQMSTSTQKSGSTGAVINTNNFTTTQGAPGKSGTSQTVIAGPGTPSVNVQQGETPGPWNWMDDAITNALKNWPRG